ncbi:hypothetical protein AJ78_08357 [Emergomyces pasteurianus Ep9510]|uniref:Uncharacterized protein n=1 Tax=Emergomyces pasteurianus Ep9510 TaxID=1447872 RepID=A0A1J9P4B3_9EURO|nr:hypothetical protein AJ78_08357 [Emergomyces pasteurianus Ep9510]
MTGRSMCKGVEKFRAKSMKELENFTTSVIAFHASDVEYFNEADHRKIIKAVTYFNIKTQKH